MSWYKRSGNDGTQSALHSGDAELPSALRAVRTALNLRLMVEEVTLEDFHRQENSYEHDCSQGRELLFLIANHEWVRGTSEIVNLSRSDAIETEIKVDIDLRQITHEAFRDKTGQLWLPISVLPIPKRTDQRYLEPDPFATVTDAAGNLLPLMPADELGNQISAALAEIIVNMAIAHVRDMPGTPAHNKLDSSQAVSPRVASRDQRILLAAAICQLLRHGAAQQSASPGSTSADEDLSPEEALKKYRKALEGDFEKFQAAAANINDTEQARSTERAIRAKNLLLRLIDPYIKYLGQRAGIIETPKSERHIFVPELAYRAIRVLQALAASTIIVVPADFGAAPTVLNLRVPARNLKPAATSFRLRKPASLLNFHKWLIRPSGHLEIDILLPMADADRQIHIYLSDGMSFEEPSSKAGSDHTALPRLDIEARRPAPMQDLATAKAEKAKAMEKAEKATAERRPWPANAAEPLTCLARAKAAAVDRLGNHYEERPDGLFRRASVDRLGPRALVARVPMIQDIIQHATPQRAIIRADVKVDDRDYFSAARTSSIMSMIVMGIILVSIVGWHYLIYPTASSSTLKSPEVAAIVLTLFVTIQADRMRRPDRTTLKGLLSSPSTLLITPSVLPSLALAVALSFDPGVLGGSLWAAGCIVAQALFLAFMWRGPLTAIKASSCQARGNFRLGERRKFGTDPLDYSHFEALRSDYWRNTTAEALTLGRMAYGYVIWQGTNRPTDEAGALPPRLEPVLAAGKGPAAGDKLANVLALLHSSTRRQAITFVVFRDKLSDWLVDENPGENDLPTPSAPIVRRLDLDPDRLAPTDNVTSKVDIFIGLHGGFPVLSGHPLTTVLKAARGKLIVLEALLPFPPPPLDGYQDKQWARVRVALRNSGDISRLNEFLDQVYEEFGRLEFSTHVLAVQADPTVRPAVIFEGERSSYTGNDDMPAFMSGDLHVPPSDEPSDAPTWRMVTACAEARSNIESDIFDQLPPGLPDFELMHLNFALMHGIAVLIILLHEPSTPSPADLAAGDGQVPPQHGQASETAVSDRTVSDFGTVINGKVSLDQLGQITSCPLVRIQFRWLDRPGGFLNVLDSISSALGQRPPAISQEDRTVSYARFHVATGRIAEGDLTVRLHSAAREGADWHPALTERMARNISADAVLNAIGHRDLHPGSGYPDRPENPVIRIDLLAGDLLQRAPQPSTDPDGNAHLGLPARRGEERMAEPVVRTGLFGVHGTPDTSGYGGLQVHRAPVLASPRPYGGNFDELAHTLETALGTGFADAIERVVADRGELTFYVRRERLTKVASQLRDDPALCFELCSGVSGVHYPNEAGRELHAVYHLLSITHNRRLRLEVTAPDADPHIPSLVGVYPTCNWHERETWDFFGIIFDGHPALTRIQMPDDWKGHPQRKDYPLGGIPVEYRGAKIPAPDERRHYS